MRVTDYVADFIYDQGVDEVFLLTGGGSIYLDDGIACHKKLKHISVRHEATAPMMAAAYAKITKNLGVVYVTTGPGGTNAVSGLAEAWVDSVPILIISGQVQRKYTSRNANIEGLRTFGTQEIDIIKVVKPITKYAAMINEPENMRYHLEKAVFLAKNGRPGPVWLDIPLDVQSAIIDEVQLKGFEPEYEKNDPPDREIEETLKLLSFSKNPLIIAGQGIKISKAIPEFKRLLECLDIPVILSRLGQDILPFSHRNNFGHGGIKGLRFTKAIMKESDLILSIGSRLSVPFLGGSKLDAFSQHTKVIMVDIDEAELKKPNLKVDWPIKADARKFIKKLLKKTEEFKPSNYKDWIKKCQGYKKTYPLITSEHKRDPIDLYYFIHCLDELSGEGDIFISDAGSSYYIMGQVLKFEKNQCEITSSAFASMGLTIPLAIGASIADKNARILAVTGDGSLELSIQELKTMSYYNLNIKLFVINNGGYVSIRDTQDTLFKGRYIGSNQVGNEMLNFRKIADAFDLPYFKIQRYEELYGKISEIISQKGPSFIEVVCDSKQKIIEPLEC